MISVQLKGRDFLRVNDWEPNDLLQILDLADRMKARLKQGIRDPHLEGRSLGMIFSKPSTRTRVSFEVGISQLGGTGLYLSANDLQLGRGETIKDTAIVLSRYLDGIMIRTFKQSDVDELAEYSTIPVINGLTDEFHPCQALADVMTIRERMGELEGVKVAYLGDGNNVCHSLMIACAKLGANFVAGVPDGYDPDEKVVGWAKAAAEASGATVEVVHDATEAARGADVLYTDVWTSMGQDEERDKRLRDLTGFGIDDRMVALASNRAIVMHCLPAHYGEEVTESVLHGPRSAAWDQAENRLHAQKALMALVIP